MTTTATTTQAPKAQHAFERARALYEERLNLNELQRLDEISNLNHLLAKAEAISRELRTKARSTGLGKKASNLASRLAPFERILEGVCKLPPMGGDLIWGSVSFILERGTTITFLEEVLGFCVGMGEEIKHLQDVEETFGESDLVVSAVEAVYVAIIEFWAKAVQYYRMKMKKDIKSRLKSWLASSKPMTDEFKTLEAKISKQKTWLHEVEATQHHAEEKLQLQMARRKELTKWIDASHYERDLSAAEQHRYPGTCEWLRDKQAYQQWMKDQASGLLVIYGTAGVGKTILSSWLVNEARSLPSQHITLYHYFKETDDSKNTPLAAARSLLDQLYDIFVSTNHPLTKMLESELQGVSRKIHIDFEPLWKILSLLLSQYSQPPNTNSTFAVTIMFDAMDECKGSKILVQSLRKLVYATSNKILAVITARQSGEHVDELQRIHPNQTIPLLLEIGQDDVKDDIAAFVKHTVMQIERLDNPKHFKLRDHLSSMIGDAKNHQGMFLWAYLMCKEVECQLHISGIQKLVQHLPKGLDGMYGRICGRISENDEASREFSRLVLQWIVASRRPMTFAELEEALRVTTDNNSSGNDFFGTNGGLLWSRRDIVRSCGDLVRYTGLDQGDTISIVHLSAQQFLSTKPSSLLSQLPREAGILIEPFLVDLRSAELQMGMVCIKYMLSTSSYPDTVIFPIDWGDGPRTARRETFKGRYPLFDYAALYWTVYAPNTIQSSPHSSSGSVHQLLAAVSEFTQSTVSDVWIEELIRLTYIEFAQSTVRRFTTLGGTLVLSDISRWSNLVLKALLDFSKSLSSCPQIIRLCILQTKSTSPTYDNTTQDIAPLEADPYRDWVHYDVNTINIFSGTHASKQPLKCQVLDTGVRLQPQLTLHQSHERFEFCSVAVSPPADFIAVTHAWQSSLRHVGYFTKCWKIADADGTSGIDDWTTVILSDYHTEKRELFSHNAVAFGQDNTIITPGGIFSLQTKARVKKPSDIYDPGPTHKLTQVFFSKMGKRVGRICDAMLEVLDTHGTSIFKQELGAAKKIIVNGFSNTGTKIIVTLRKKGFRLSCFLISEAGRFPMPCAFANEVQPGPGVFTRDEGRFIAPVGIEYSPFQQLAVWTFLQDKADMIYIFSGQDFFVFDLVPGTPEGSGVDALIVEGSGNTTRQSLDVAWLPEQQPALRVRWVLTRHGSNPELVIWSIHPNDVRAETWKIGSPQPELRSHALFHAKEPIPALRYRSVSTISQDGNYFNLHSLVIDARTMTATGLGVFELDPSKRIANSAFSFDGALFACICFQGDDKPTLYVFDISRGPQLTERASHTFDRSVYGLAFSGHDTNLLAVHNHVMRLEGHALIVTRVDQDISGFSDCGLYFYEDLPLTIHRLPGVWDPETPLATEIRHPLSMKLNGYYIYSPHVLKFIGVPSRVFSLIHRLIHEDKYHYRVICVLPDVMANEATLVWPKEDTETLKLVTVWKGAPRQIDTGIRKGDLMNEEEWHSWHDA